ncbi:hypothetical protein SLEP1_g58041 [Rubroshorea leprosula]|uniref:Uncharacterized protein n=1 Tax=Rubroshorea leprosula TaxID=152421 RepID=A0AAV5MN61_9ROSI|nr:hypothetical protein SLEP1_g58041 [Rubroshorea leprosula]
MGFSLPASARTFSSSVTYFAAVASSAWDWKSTSLIFAALHYSYKLHPFLVPLITIPSFSCTLAYNDH